MVLDEDDMSAMLECPVCMVSMVAPIAMCQNGHSLCSVCRDKLTQCPLCKGPFVAVRNRALESIAETMPLPCKNAIAGCTAKLAPSERAEHAAVCPHRVYECLPRKSNGCKWQGGIDQLYQHLVTDHTDLFTYVAMPATVNFNTQLAFEAIRLAKLDNDLFWIHLKQDPKTNKFFRAVQYIGPPENACKFEYSYEFHLMDNSSSIIFKRLTYSEADNMCDMYENDNVFNNIVFCVMKCLAGNAKVESSMNIRKITEA